MKKLGTTILKNNFKVEKGLSMDRKSRLALSAISLIPLVITLGNSMLIPILPIMERELAISAFQSSLVITVYSVVAVILIPFAGLLSDRLGRKTVILPSLIVTGLGGLVAGIGAWHMANAYWWILAGRLLQGIGAAGAFPIVLPLVGDIFRDEKEVSHGLGIIETFNTLGKVLSPILGALFAVVVWFLPFFTIPLFSLIAVTLMILWVESPHREETPVTLRVFWQMVKHVFHNEGRWLVAIFTSGGIIMTVLFGLLFFLSKALEDSHGIDGIKKGVILAIPLASLCIASYLAGKYVGKGKDTMRLTALVGLTILTVSAFAMIFFVSIYPLIGIMFLSGVGIGIALPSLDSLITGTIEKGERGTITSIYSSMRYLGVAIGPPLFALLMNHSQMAVFVAATLISSIAPLCMYFLVRTRQDAKKHK